MSYVEKYVMIPLGSLSQIHFVSLYCAHCLVSNMVDCDYEYPNNSFCDHVTVFRRYLHHKICNANLYSQSSWSLYIPYVEQDQMNHTVVELMHTNMWKDIIVFT
jgi:hypothetical protein